MFLNPKKYKGEDKEFYLTLKNTLGFSPKNILYYKKALTHKSVKEKDDYGIIVNNERLEFLGDSVIDTVVADFLFNKYPMEDEGFLTNLRSKIVKRTHLDKLGKNINLDILLKSSTFSPNKNSHILGNALEALVGAIYLDRGYKYSKIFIVDTLLKKHINLQEIKDTEENFKSVIIEYVQHNKLKLEFKTELRNKENNSTKKFISFVYINGEEKGNGIGFSKKEAEQNASKNSLLNIDISKN